MERMAEDAGKAPGIRLFLYGELRAGFWNNFLLSGSKHLGQAKTREEYTLFMSVFPFAMESPRMYPIEGDLYLVNEKMLEKIDALKGHPYWYRRKEVEVVLDGDCVLAWMYVGLECQGTVLPTGNYLDHCGEPSGGRARLDPKDS